MKKMARKLATEKQIIFYCDFHGHSKRYILSLLFNSKNVFMYGNNEENMEDEYRLFPYIMSKLCPYFSFKASR